MGILNRTIFTYDLENLLRLLLSEVCNDFLIASLLRTEYFDVIVDAPYSAVAACLHVLLCDVARLIVEESMRIPKPSYAAEKHPNYASI